MVFKGRGFTSGGQKSVSGFSAAACKIQGSKYYIESLPLVVKYKRSCFSQGERSIYTPKVVSLLYTSKKQKGQSDVLSDISIWISQKIQKAVKFIRPVQLQDI